MKLSLFRTIVPVLLLALSACNKAPNSEPETNTAAPTRPIPTNIIGLFNTIDYAEISSRHAYISIKLTGTHRKTGHRVNYASSLRSNIQPENVSFSIPSPSVINPDVDYGLSIELVSGNNHPGFAAWFPLDLNHYKGELLSTRLFPLNSSTLINYQVLALSCDSITLEIATDKTTMWLNANGRGYFLTRTKAGDFANSYARFDESNQQLTLGDEQYNCTPNNLGSRMAKKRFAGATFTALNRKDGWAITVYNRSLKWVSRRGLQTQLKQLTHETLLNANWQLQTTDGTIAMQANDKQCNDGETGFNARIEGNDYSACGEKLR